jgi:hypothetical protein
MKGRLLLIGLLYWAGVAAARVEHLYVRVPALELTQDFVAQTGFIRDHVSDDDFAFGYVTAEGFFKLPEPLRQKLIPLNAREWARHAFDPKTLERREESTELTSGTHEAYHTYETLTSELQQLAAKYPNLVTLTSAGKSVQGRELWYVKISSPKFADNTKPNLLYVSSMHGDEVVGKEMMVYLVRDLLSLYGTDARITSLVDTANLFILPSMNPDGTVAQERFNADGIDLNRNFPELDENATSTEGRAVETLALMKLHQKYRFELAVNFHTGAVCVNIPWDSKRNTASQKFGDDKLILTLAHRYANLNGPMSKVDSGSFDKGVTYGFEWYQVLGGMQDWASFFYESTHATIELSDIKWPSANVLPARWNDNRESLIQYLEDGLTGFHLKVTDTDGNLLDATVEMATATRALHYHGLVHRPAVGGSQLVTVSAPGYVAKTMTLEPARFDGNFVAVTLTKSAH